jgi:uncharacterized protein (TIGR02246 family)
MKRKWTLVIVAGILATATAGFLIAEDKASPRPADEQAIRAATQAFAKAFESGNADAVTALFTENGEYHGDNDAVVRGRAALAKAYAGFFAKKADLKAESKTDAVRFLGNDTAIEEGTFTVKAKDQPAVSSRYSSLYVRQDGKWLMAMLKEWDDDSINRANLQDVAWLIGTWETSGGDVTARTTYEWTPNKAFIHARYTITPKDGKAVSGSQVIGVDPATGTIRSWTFDGDGGIGEATWSWDSGRWAIDSAGTLADGSPTTALNFLTKTGSDTFSWKSVKRTVNGEELPDIGPVTVKRVAGTK